MGLGLVLGLGRGCLSYRRAQEVRVESLFPSFTPRQEDKDKGKDKDKDKGKDKGKVRGAYWE